MKGSELKTPAAVWRADWGGDGRQGDAEKATGLS